MAGFDGGPLSEPWAGLVAGFDSAAGSEPTAGLLAGFAASGRRYLATVPRSSCSSRAMRRYDQLRAARAIIDCWRLTLSRFITPPAKPSSPSA